MSGQEVEDPDDPGMPKIIKEHTMIATPCRQGKGIFLRCPYHMINGFMTHPILVARYLDGQNGKARQARK